MIDLKVRGLAVSCTSVEEARDFLICLTGAQRLTVVSRQGTRRIEASRSTPKSIEDVARRHVVGPVVLAETARLVALPDSSPYLSPVSKAPAQNPATSFREAPNHFPQTRPNVPKTAAPRVAKPRVSPLMEHVRGEEAPAISAPAVPKRRGRPPGMKVAPGSLSAPRNSVGRPALYAPPEEPGPEQSYLDRIVEAFAEEEAPTLPGLAADLFGESTGRNLQKVKMLLERLVATERLVRTGAAAWRLFTEEDAERGGKEAQKRFANRGQHLREYWARRKQDAEVLEADAEEEPRGIEERELSELGLG